MQMRVPHDPVIGRRVCSVEEGIEGRKVPNEDDSAGKEGDGGRLPLYTRLLLGRALTAFDTWRIGGQQQHFGAQDQNSDYM